MRSITVLATCLAVFGVVATIQVSAEGRTPRGEYVHAIVEKWAPFVRETYGVSASKWAGGLAPAFANASVDTLKAASEARSFDVMTHRLMGRSAVSATESGTGVTPMALGDDASDLTFVPIAPCRIFDTRLAGGVINAGTSRDLDVTAVTDYSFQGGDASNCSGAGAAGSFAAVAINLTTVGPATTGFLTAYPFGTTRPLAATMIYTGGLVQSNLAVVRLDQGAAANEMTVFAEKQLHLVGDVVGYYIKPQATALQCVDTATTVVSIPAGGGANSFPPACPAGYTQTATNCTSSTYDLYLVLHTLTACSARNAGSSAANLTSTRTCCRVPGR